MGESELYLFLRGPFALFSFLVFLGGTTYQIVYFFKNTTKKTYKNTITLPKEWVKHTPNHQTKNLARWKGTVLSTYPVLTIMSSIFHILVIITPIFLLSHGILIKESWGIYLPSFSEKISDIFTLIIMLFGTYFLYRRIFNKNIKAISQVADFFTFLLVFLPYITGFLAYHQIFNYNYMIILHILAGELMIMLMPFSKLKHFIYFFLNRFFVQNEYSFFKRGTRVWY